MSVSRTVLLILLVMLFSSACASRRPGPPEGLEPRAQLSWWLDRWEEARPGEDPDGRARGLSPTVIRRGMRDLAVSEEPDPMVYAANGLLALEQGDRPRAERWLDDALALDPHLPAAVQARAQLALTEGNTAGARRLLESLLTVRPEMGVAHEALAGVAFLEGDLEEAEASLAMAQALDGPSARLAYHRGLVAEFAKDTDAALVHYARALELDPGHRQASRRRRALVLAR